jgi:hypothetical protein
MQIIAIWILFCQWRALRISDGSKWGKAKGRCPNFPSLDWKAGNQKGRVPLVSLSILFSEVTIKNENGQKILRKHSGNISNSNQITV